MGVSTDLGIDRKLRIWALPIKSAVTDVKKTTDKILVVLQDLRVELGNLSNLKHNLLKTFSKSLLRVSDTDKDQNIFKVANIPSPEVEIFVVYQISLADSTTNIQTQKH